MQIVSLHVKNWRNFKSAKIDIGNRVFLVGPNASGKSNLLDVFRFLRDISTAGGGLQKATEDRGGLSKIRFLSARQKPEVEIDITLKEDEPKGNMWRYRIGLKQETRGYRRPILSYEQVWRGDEVILNRPDKYDKADSERMIQTALEQINANAEFRVISKYFDSIVYLHLVPQLLRYPEFFSGPSMPSDPFGRSFIERIIKTPEKTRNSRLKKVEEALKIAVPQFKELELKKDERGIPHLQATYEHWRARGAKQQEKEFSDGTLRLIGLFWSLLEGESLLLLEEPELYLNSGIVSKLPSIMYKLQTAKRRQIFVSTHSADLLSDTGIGGEEIIILQPEQEGTSVYTANSIASVRLLLEGGMAPGEAVLPIVQTSLLDKLGDFK